MSYFDFSSLIEKYSCTFTVINAGSGRYNDLGEWESTQTKCVKTGAIIGISERRIYRSDGVLTEKDEELFMRESLGAIDKACVLYNGNKYSVEVNPQNNPEFTGVWHYTLKWVSAFKEKEGDRDA